jgi:hypothetical protein
MPVEAAINSFLSILAYFIRSLMAFLVDIARSLGKSFYPYVQERWRSSFGC